MKGVYGNKRCDSDQTPSTYGGGPSLENDVGFSWGLVEVIVQPFAVDKSSGGPDESILQNCPRIQRQCNGGARREGI